jgi:hypothetical protein
MTTDTDDYEPQTAMLLTEQEWEDLAEIVKHYLDDTLWAQVWMDDPANHPLGSVIRKRALANRIIEAVAIIPALGEGWSDTYKVWKSRVGPSGTRLLVQADIYDCGTTACIAGWATWLWSAEVDSDRSIGANAVRILDIPTELADRLFNDFDLITAGAAAARLRDLVQADLAHNHGESP